MAWLVGQWVGMVHRGSGMVGREMGGHFLFFFSDVKGISYMGVGM